MEKPQSSRLAYVKGRVVNALPATSFYILQFGIVLLLFGSQYAMVVSCSTVLFQGQCRLRHQGRDFILLFFLPLLLCTLAFAATRNAVLCVLLNVAVPFFMVFWKSSQFTPKGYLGFTMTFAFLELRPIPLAQLPMQLLAVAVCSGLLILALILYAHRHRQPSPVLDICSSLNRLADLIERMADSGSEQEIRHELYNATQRYQHLGYDRRHLLHIPDREKEVFHLLALLYQRAGYLVTDESWQHNRSLPEFPTAIHTLSQTARQLASAWPDRCAELRPSIHRLLEATALPEGRLRIFYRSVLHTFLLLCGSMEHTPRLPVWQRIPWKEVWESLRQRCSLDCYEFRFALRLSAVMVISYTVSYLWDFEHTYWFPLHAFLLLQPSYEESAHRMVTRPLGTLIGCIVVHLTYPLLPGLPGVFLFSLLMISIMYCCTPGSWVHPIFSTGFALTMATLTVPEMEAIWLRLFYLALAVALVFLVNLFVFPNRSAQQFQRNMKELFLLQADYWNAIRQSLRTRIPAARFSELLSQFHLIYGEAYAYTARLSGEACLQSRKVLVTLWAMFAELEQVEGLIQTGVLEQELFAPLDRIAAQFSARIYPPPPSVSAVQLEEIPSGDLYYLLDRYLTRAASLLSVRSAEAAENSPR